MVLVHIGYVTLQCSLGTVKRTKHGLRTTLFWLLRRRALLDVGCGYLNVVSTSTLRLSKLYQRRQLPPTGREVGINQSSNDRGPERDHNWVICSTIRLIQR
jgi:hypothetical protein